MKPARIIILSLQNLKRRKLRTALTVWGMSVGIGAMVLLISLAAGLQKETRESFLTIIPLTELQVTKGDPQKATGATKPDDMFTDAERSALAVIPHVKVSYPFVSLPPLKLKSENKTTPQYFKQQALESLTDRQRNNIEQGKIWTNNADEAIVLTPKVVDELGILADQLVGKQVELIVTALGPTGQQQDTTNTYTATVSGILKKEKGTGNFAVNMMSQGLAEKIATTAPNQFSTTPSVGGFSEMILIVDAPENVKAVRQTVSDKSWFATGAEETLDQLNKNFLIMKIVLGVFGGIALFVALIGITNSMLMAVLERTREIGIFVALGASRKTIAWIFLAEAAWLGIFGALLGILGAYLIGKAIVTGIAAYFAITKKDSGDFSIIQFAVSSMLFFATLVGAVIVTLLAGWLPARRAAKQDPIKALRHE